jgi:hypothetical protein
MAPDDKASLDRNPTAGLIAIMSAKSCSAWVEISITGALCPSRWSFSESSKPLSGPRLTSTNIRPQLLDPLERLSTGCNHADDRDPLVLEQETRGVEERRVVIDDQAAHSQTFSMSSDSHNRSMVCNPADREDHLDKGLLLRGSYWGWTADPLASRGLLLLACKHRCARRRVVGPHSRRTAFRGQIIPPTHLRPAPESRLSTRSPTTQKNGEL